MLFFQRRKATEIIIFYLFSFISYLREALYGAANPCLRQNNIVPYMRRQRKLSNGRERLVAGLEPYYVYEQKENRPTLSVCFLFVGAPSGIRTRDPLIKSQLLYQLS